VANALAYYDTATITAVKSFIVQAPGVRGGIQTHNLGIRIEVFFHYATIAQQYILI
jgi:hypothetical protein